MSKVQLTVIEGVNEEFRSLALVNLDVIPRVGEFIFYQAEHEKSDSAYRILQIIHHITPELLTEICMMSLEDVNYTY